MKAEKINLEQKIEKQQKEVVSLFGKIESLKNEIKENIEKLSEQEDLKSILAS